ncbi:hypothetical protein D3C81_1795420 [compost metagenome]
MSSAALNIPQDPFLNSKTYQNYEQYRIFDRIIDHKLKTKESISESEWQDYQELNPLFWAVYYKKGKYYFDQKRYGEALDQFQRANALEVTTAVDQKNIASYIRKIEKKGGHR